MGYVTQNPYFVEESQREPDPKHEPPPRARFAWEPQEGESERHYSWFYAFLSLGPSRSVASAYAAFCERHSKPSQTPAKGKQASGQWYVASDKWHWNARASAFDAHQRREDEAKLLALREARIKELVESEFKIGQKLIDRGHARLDLLKPVTIYSRDGKTVAEAAPPASDLASVKMFAEGTRLCRQSLGMLQTGSAGTAGEDPNAPNVAVEPETPPELLTDAELINRLVRRTTS